MERPVALTLPHLAGVVSSTYVKSVLAAEKKIAYSGTGVIDDRQRPGWMANFFDRMWVVVVALAALLKLAFKNELEELSWMIDDIAEKIASGVSPQDIAVITKKNKTLELIAK